MEKRESITEATPEDWYDFWYNSESDGREFREVWEEMDQIEPLTPVTQSQRKD